ncbi:UDP-N-acetylmuramate dehydrogenase [Corynebacterium aurimucosum]|uniref:UDP-N-acetylmuramate dehydrogenase n=1 Tax=Corynebacterium aurimucosum TaxID=169292 RepID=UPI00191E00FA|nr:UDP-N-acetylmuramate dehydrogenase [Corynebacterium aurimucosum]QQU95838.1 UDP-N-acetylmuramate dehydrogenase [Corynebacterium aurimucosum]UTA71266.1 UDP-N-acetylmuramate dehydrogenase [Corynebacterium aurimucosum]WJY69443.1 UDP-N-acetylenolpyruvoylglucosamine reductase [Corynebacterium aurimucosum]
MLDKFLTLADIDGVTLDSETTFADLTTLRIGGAPLVTVRCASAEAAIAALAALDESSQDYLVVGGGSNLVVAEGQLDVVVVTLDFEDIDVTVANGLVRADAGAAWDDVVALTVECGLGGIECLSGIPGNAGAVPVQNVGAYGAETSDVLTQVYLYERATRTAKWVPAEELELAYRYSNLKFTGRGVVLAIELQLTTDGLSKPLRFGQLTQNPGERRPVADVREEVLKLRRGKGMVLDPDDHDTWSAGSFFTNPIVEPELADSIQATVRAARGDEDADRMPRHAVPASGTASGEGKEKLSAAWLIERAGFAKGYPGEGAGARATLSTKHTLALTNRGEATADDIVALARDIRAGVQKAFGVTLEPEPIWLGVSI